MSPPSLFFLFLFFLFFYWCRLRRNIKQTTVINITKCKRISGKKKDFNLTSRQAAARDSSLISFIFRLNGGLKGWVKSISRPGPLSTCRSEFATAYMHAQNWKSFLLNGLLVFLIVMSYENFTPMTMTFVDEKEGPALNRWKSSYLPDVDELSLIHIWRCRRIERCRSRWSPYH